MTIRTISVTVLACALLACPAFSQETNLRETKAQLDKLKADQLEAAKKRRAEADAEVKKLESDPVSDFRANFGLGVAVFFFKDPHVDTAELLGTDRRVVITKKRSHQVSPWLQTTFVWDGIGTNTMSPGIFAGVGMGADNSFLDTFGLGVQVSFKRLTPKTSLNLGLGHFWSSRQELADGIKEGEPLPATIDQIKYQTRSTKGVMLNLSFGFQ